MGELGAVEGEFAVWARRRRAVHVKGSHVLGGRAGTVPGFSGTGTSTSTVREGGLSARVCFRERAIAGERPCDFYGLLISL